MDDVLLAVKVGAREGGRGTVRWRKIFEFRDMRALSLTQLHK